MRATMKYIVVLVLMGLSSVNAVSIDFTKKMARVRLEKEGLPDPVCRTGIISLPIGSLGKKQACCPNYCKECDDYPTCKSVRGQDSKNACCASNVLKMECGKGSPANVCLKKCTEALPPCIMEDGQVWKLKPPKVNAADDCNKAIGDWRKENKAAIKAGKEGAEQFEAKIALKTLERVLETHKKLVEETEETIKEAKAEVSADEASFKEVKDTIDLLDQELKKAVKLNDFMAQAKLHDLKVELQNETSGAKAAEQGVSDAISDMDSAKADLENYLEVLTGHKKEAEKHPTHLLDKQQDIDIVHEVAEKIRDLQFKVTHDTDVLETALKDAEETAKKAKKVVKEYLTTTTTTTTNLDCQCYHCGGNEEFNGADVCGFEDPGYCDANSAPNSGCWTARTEGCVCSTHKIIQPCQCYHCGGTSTFNNADVCGAASDVCGPTSPDNGGCWNNVVGATCQCDSFSTTG